MFRTTCLVMALIKCMYPSSGLHGVPTIRSPTGAHGKRAGQPGNTTWVWLLSLGLNPAPSRWDIGCSHGNANRSREDSALSGDHRRGQENLCAAPPGLGTACPVRRPSSALLRGRLYARGPQAPPSPSRVSKPVGAIKLTLEGARLPQDGGLSVFPPHSTRSISPGRHALVKKDSPG